MLSKVEWYHAKTKPTLKFCSLSAFDFAHHGNSKYGSPCDAAKDRRSTQGKMEKSFLR